jgi:3-hydroxymyristoyl/3-hydroxydecanoyl-(acyl carrier protein) dehydratase
VTGRGFARPLDAVDRVEVRASGAGWLVTAGKTVCRDDPYLAGHLRGLTLYPAVFLMETVRQAVGRALSGTWGEWLEIESLHHARALKPMLDGDELILSIVVTPDGGKLRVRADVARPDGTPVAVLDLDLIRGGVDVD